MASQYFQKEHNTTDGESEGEAYLRYPHHVKADPNEMMLPSKVPCFGQILMQHHTYPSQIHE